MFPDGRDRSIVQRGIDEAMACRDVLTPAPRRPTWLSSTRVRVESVLRALRAVPVKDRLAHRPTPESMAESIR